MALALNNLKRVDMPLNKETKPTSRLKLYDTPTASLQLRKINQCPGYNTKQSDSEVTAMLEIWGMQSTPLMLSLPGQLWPEFEAPDGVLSMGQIELNYVLMLN